MCDANLEVVFDQHTVVLYNNFLKVSRNCKYLLTFSFMSSKVTLGTIIKGYYLST